MANQTRRFIFSKRINGVNMNTKLTIGTIITLVLAISGTYYLSQEDTAYYCEDRDLVMICEKLSKVNSIGIQTRCYYEETYKTCKSGWEEIEIGQELTKEIPIPKGKQYLCDQIKCVVIE